MLAVQLEIADATIGGLALAATSTLSFAAVVRCISHREAVPGKQAIPRLDADELDVCDQRSAAPVRSGGQTDEVIMGQVLHRGPLDVRHGACGLPQQPPPHGAPSSPQICAVVVALRRSCGSRISRP